MGKRVLVTGGSVAANSLAWWLCKGGYDITVVERAPHLVLGGQSVDLRGTGREVLQRMRLEEAVKRHGTGETGWTYVDDNGRQIAAFEVADVGEDGPTAGLEILRGDLAKVFYDEVRDHVDYRFGDTLEALDNGSDVASVTFKSGRREAYDLVLVAEGVGSTTRELIFHGENHPRWMDMTIAYFTIPKIDSDGTDARWFNAPGGRVVFLRPDPHGDTRAVLMVQHEARSAEQKSTEQAKAWLAETFRDAAWETPRVLEGLRETGDLYFEVLRQVKLDRWSNGRVALVGDAAWCTTPISGIGTTLAVVGAYVLAGELASTGDHQKAFAQYERIMRPFVEEGQSVSKINEKWTHPQSKFGIAAQHAMLELLSRPGLRDLFLKLGMRESNGIELPRYTFSHKGSQEPQGEVAR